ncbi:hypothetical protein [Actinocorallia populi]|uniref:hypothetical protein n=1 Tax=Actinocorallia populi TaxID=2079200 RepID=UPI0013005114|nr:hypothetical protein [Actinocorallia populi]
MMPADEDGWDRYKAAQRLDDCRRLDGDLDGEPAARPRGSTSTGVFALVRR